MDPKAVLADRVLNRRLVLGLSIDRAAESVGMSATTWTRVEQAKTVQRLTYAGVERALSWEPGSCQTILSGGEPTLAPAPAQTPSTASPTAGMLRYPDDQVARHLWDTPDPDLADEDREALVQMYRALKRAQTRGATTRVQRRRASGYA